MTLSSSSELSLMNVLLIVCVSGSGILKERLSGYYFSLLKMEDIIMHSSPSNLGPLIGVSIREMLGPTVCEKIDLFPLLTTHLYALIQTLQPSRMHCQVLNKGLVLVF